MHEILHTIFWEKNKKKNVISLSSAGFVLREVKVK